MRWVLAATGRARAEDLVRKYERRIVDHRAYIVEHGVDPPHDQSRLSEFTIRDRYHAPLHAGGPTGERGGTRCNLCVPRRFGAQMTLRSGHAHSLQAEDAP